jgi:thiol:disulfide interchange protein
MDRTDETSTSAPTTRPAPKSSRGSQSRVPGALLWLIAAALAFRLATLIASRGHKDTGEGLVRWQPAGAVASSARQSNRPLLYDFTAAWCGPCHRLDAEGWADSQVAGLVNESFVPARAVDRAREDGQNPPWIAELEQRYAVVAFPTLIIADPSGRELARMEGFMGKEKLVQFLQDAKKKAGK